VESSNGEFADEYLRATAASSATEFQQLQSRSPAEIGDEFFTATTAASASEF
jgi:hypothetical protein